VSRPEAPSDTRGPGTQEALAQAVAAATTAGQFELAAMRLRELSAVRTAAVDGQPLEGRLASGSGEGYASAVTRSQCSPVEGEDASTPSENEPRKTDLPERSSGRTEALAEALRLAAEAGKWDIVSELSRQLALMQASPSAPPTQLRVVKG